MNTHANGPCRDMGTGLVDGVISTLKYGLLESFRFFFIDGRELEQVLLPLPPLRLLYLDLPWRRCAVNILNLALLFDPLHSARPTLDRLTSSRLLSVLYSPFVRIENWVAMFTVFLLLFKGFFLGFDKFPA